MSKRCWNCVKQIPVFFSAALLPVNSAFAQSKTDPKLSTQLTSVDHHLEAHSLSLNTADKLKQNAGILEINAQMFSLGETQQTTSVDTVAQEQPKPKQRKPGYSDYIGLGGSIGLTGDKTALGSGGLAIFSKNRITENLSFHSTNVVFGKRTTVSSNALTFGIPIRSKSSGQVIAFPFVGGGVLIRGSFTIDGLVVGGVDAPISDKLTATTQLHVGFPGGETEVGLQIGLGYNFRFF